MRIKNRKNLNVLKALGLVLVLILAIVTIIKIDLSLQVYAANTAPKNIADSIGTLPEIPQNPLPNGTVTSPFGERINPITSEAEHHNGVDVAAPEGTPIHLAFSGVVIEVGESDVYGNYVLVDHSNGLYTRYCHCSTVLAETGYILKKGEIIALVGNTGWSTGPHLHLEVISNGKYCNPEWLIKW